MAAIRLTDYVTTVEADFFYFKTSAILTTIEGIEIINRLVVEPYLPILKNNAQEVQLTEDDTNKYKFKPRLLSKLLYGTENLYYIILLLNNMTVETFIPKKIYLLSSSNRSLIETIINRETNMTAI